MGVFTESASIGNANNLAAKIGRWAMVVLAASVALYSLRFYGVLGDIWWGVDPGIRNVIQNAPVQSLTHMLISPIALLIGPLQFFPKLRTSLPRIHRWVGRIYVAACLLAGAGALATCPFASGGPIAGIGFGILGVAWIATTFVGWRAAWQRRFDTHRLLMRFSYAMTFGAVTLRIQIPIGFALGYQSYSSMSPWLAYTSWIPNVILVAVYSMLERQNRKRSTSMVSRPASTRLN